MMGNERLLRSRLAVPVECSRNRSAVFAPRPHLSSECGLDLVETTELFRAGRRVRDFPCFQISSGYGSIFYSITITYETSKWRWNAVIVRLSRGGQIYSGSDSRRRRWTLIPDCGIRDEWRGDANRESLQQATYGRRSERRCRSQRRATPATAPGAGRSRGQQPGGAGARPDTAPGVAGGRAGCGAAGAMVCALRAALCGERCIGDAAHRGRGLGLCASYPSSSHPGEVSVRPGE